MNLNSKTNDRFFYKYGEYPKNIILRRRLHNAMSRLYMRLSSLDVSKLNISEYNQRYFGNHICNEDSLRLNITKYGYVLAWALSGIKKNIGEIVFVDYGGGHGMLSLLAKEYGLGTVIHNDIYPVSCDDAKKIAQEIGLEADYYVPGVIDDVINLFNSKKINCDVVANYDVIEHIYDIKDFLTKLHKLSNDHMSIFLASAANAQNPYIRRTLMRQHKEFELKDREKREGRKPTDATRAIFNLRKEIILNHTASLTEKVVDELAVLTRGLIKEDIIQKVDEYISSGILPEAPDHPTNTCDPYTGNWFEHLMDPYELAQVLDSTGFHTVVMCGYYDRPNKVIKRAVKIFLNMLIRVMGRNGLYLAPYYAIFSVK